MWTYFAWLTSQGPESAVKFVNEKGFRLSNDSHKYAAEWLAEKLWDGEKDRQVRYDITVGYVMMEFQSGENRVKVSRKRFLVTVKSSPKVECDEISQGTNDELLNALKEMDREEG